MAAHRLFSHTDPSPPPRIFLAANSAWNLLHYRRPLIEAMRQEGWEVVGLVPDPPTGEELLSRWQRVPYLRGQARSPLDDLRALRGFFNIYRREKPDLALHFTIKPNIFGGLAARLAGMPAIPTLTGLGYTALHPTGANRLVPFLYRQAFARAPWVVVQNEDDRDWLLTRQLIRPEQCRLIRGSGVDTERFQPQDTLRTSATPLVCLYIGRLLKDKGVLELIEAVGNLRASGLDLECRFLGDPSHANPSAIPESSFRRMIDREGFRYLGPAEDVRPALAAADLLVLPSYREGTPRAVLEAMAMGIPVITTDVAGCRQTVDPGRTGLLVPPADARALEDAIRQMAVMTNEKRQAMGRAGLEKVIREFDQRIVVSQYLELISTYVRP